MRRGPFLEPAGKLIASEALARLDPMAIERVRDALAMVELGAGETLVRAGDRDHDVYAVLEGTLVATRARAGSAEAPRKLGPGELIGEIVALSGGARTATVRAESAARLVAIPKRAFLDLVESDVTTLALLRAQVEERLRADQLARHLEALFGALDASVLEELEREVEWLSLQSGETLFRSGELGGDAFLVLAGRLRVSIEERGQESVVNEIGRGELVGEMALLDRAPRSATVRAVRDSELARLSGDAFERVVARFPGAMRQLARVAMARLRGGVPGRRADAPLALAVVAAHPGAGVAGFSRALADALSAFGNTTCVSADRLAVALHGGAAGGVPYADPRVSDWLAHLESVHRFVVYDAGESWSDWTDRAIGQADRVLVLCDPLRDPEGSALDRPGRREFGKHGPRHSLVLLQKGASPVAGRTARWLQAGSVEDCFHVRVGSTDDVARVARRVSGRAVCLVLGGGGARGFAHIGVLRALEEAGIPLDAVAGTSSGAIIAALSAFGLDAEAIRACCQREFVSLYDPTLPLVSLIKGGRITGRLRAMFGTCEIEDLAIPFFCVSTNLTRADLVVHRRGSLADAIRATISLPGILPPASRDGDLLIDGGLLNNLPCDVMREQVGACRLIAVNVTPDVDLPQGFAPPPALSGWEVLWRRLNPFASPLPVPHIGDILMRSTVVASLMNQRRTQREQPPDVCVTVPAAGVNLLAFDCVGPMAERGYAAAREPIAAWWAQVQADVAEREERA